MNYLGIKKIESTATVKELNALLANYNIYYQNLRNFHWNLTGENFFDLHAKFEELYNDAKVKIDEIAERILTLRFHPLSNFSEYLQEGDIQEAGHIEEDWLMVKMILENHRSLITTMRKVIKAAQKAGDEGTIDLVSGFLSSLEKRSWILDAWLSTKVKPMPGQVTHFHNQ